MPRKAKTPPAQAPAPPARKPRRAGSPQQQQAQRFLRSMPARQAPQRHQGR
jgi:hypothetical protein